MAKAAADGGGADSSVADQLRALGVKGVLVQMAERGQLVALKCEMPQCYHHKGRGAFDPVTTPRTKWAPSPDHYPILKSAGGQLRPENVRLSHIWCNNRDYGWRTQIRTLLAKGKSLAEIAEALNSKGVPPRYEPMDSRHGAQGLRVLVLPRGRRGSASESRRGRSGRRAGAPDETAPSTRKQKPDLEPAAERLLA
jgi:hypothetical protein